MTTSQIGRMTAGALLAVVLGSTAAFAQGYAVYEQSACNTARGGAGVASPCEDGSAIYFNPAALAKERRTVISAGATLVSPSGSFTNSATKTTTDMDSLHIPVPAAYMAAPVGERVTVGLGLFVPYGLETRWPNTFEGRFVGYRAIIQAPYIQPTVAFKVSDRLYIGGGVDLVHTKLQLHQRADLSTQPLTATLTFANLGVPVGTDFADVTLKGSAWGVGGHIGLLYDINDQVSIGARYMTQASIETEEGEFLTKQISTGRSIPIALPGIPAGTPYDAIVAGQFAANGKLADKQKATAGLTHPDQFVAGIAFKATPKLKVLVDYQYINWKDFDTVDVKAANGLELKLEEFYKDTHGLRVGADYAVTDAVNLRAGFDVHGAGAPESAVTPLLPEAARKEFMAGFGWRLSDRFALDGSYMYLGQDTRKGRTVAYGKPSNGEFEFMAHLIGVSLVYRF